MAITALFKQRGGSLALHGPPSPFPAPLQSHIFGEKLSQGSVLGLTSRWLLPQLFPPTLFGFPAGFTARHPGVLPIPRHVGTVLSAWDEHQNCSWRTWQWTGSRALSLGCGPRTPLSHPRSQGFEPCQTPVFVPASGMRGMATEACVRQKEEFQ